MKQRSELPYSQANAFTMSVKAVNSITAHVFTLPITWRSMDEKIQQMTKVGVVAHFGRIPAVILNSDTRFLKTEEFAAHFNLAQPTRDNVAEFTEAYHRILDEHGGTMENLPRKTWAESILTCVKGPEIGTHAMMSRYVEGLFDRVQWTQTYEADYVGLESRIIPDYWTDKWIGSVKIPAEHMPILREMAKAFGRGI